MADEYIKRQGLLDAYDAAHKGPPGGARKLIAEAPAEDVVPVVRCQDCKYWNRDGSCYSDDESHCTNPDGLDNYARPDDFCSYGERRGDGK